MLRHLTGSVGRNPSDSKAFLGWKLPKIYDNAHVFSCQDICIKFDHDIFWYGFFSPDQRHGRWYGSLCKKGTEQRCLGMAGSVYGYRMRCWTVDVFPTRHPNRWQEHHFVPAISVARCGQNPAKSIRLNNSWYMWLFGVLKRALLGWLLKSQKLPISINIKGWKHCRACVYWICPCSTKYLEAGNL